MVSRVNENALTHQLRKSAQKCSTFSARAENIRSNHPLKPCGILQRSVTSIFVNWHPWSLPLIFQRDISVLSISSYTFIVRKTHLHSVAALHTSAKELHFLRIPTNARAELASQRAHEGSCITCFVSCLANVIQTPIRYSYLLPIFHCLISYPNFPLKFFSRLKRSLGAALREVYCFYPLCHLLCKANLDICSMSVLICLNGLLSKMDSITSSPLLSFMWARERFFRVHKALLQHPLNVSTEVLLTSLMFFQILYMVRSPWPAIYTFSHSSNEHSVVQLTRIGRCCLILGPASNELCWKVTHSCDQ